MSTLVPFKSINIENDSQLNADSEIVYQDGFKWVPIQFYKRNIKYFYDLDIKHGKNPKSTRTNKSNKKKKNQIPLISNQIEYTNIWSHFLTADRNLTVSKCKHCQEIITKTKDNNIPIVKLLKLHLRNSHEFHNIINYYQLINRNRLQLKPNKFQISNDASIYREKLTKRLNQSSFEQVDGLGSNFLNTYDMNNANLDNTISNTRLATIIMVSQNLSLSLMDNFAINIILNLLPNYKQLTPQNILTTINQLNSELLSLINNSFVKGFPLKFSDSEFKHKINSLNQFKNNSNESFTEVDDDTTKNSDDDNRSTKNDSIVNFLSDMLYDKLIFLNETTLYSLSCRIWRDDYFIICLQFYDSYNFLQKTIPLYVYKLKSTDKNNKNSVTKFNIDSNFIIQRFGDFFDKYPILKDLVISITLPNYNLIDELNFTIKNILTQNSGQKNGIEFRPCITQNLSDLISLLFGNPVPYSFMQSTHMATASDKKSYIKNKNYTENNKNKINETNNETNNNIPKTQEDHDRDNLIDNLLDLTNIDIYSSIWGKINIFIREINGSSKQKDIFLEACNKFNIKPIGLIEFDKKFPSESISFLENFRYLQKAILEISPRLINEKFSIIDFTIATHLIKLLTSIFNFLNGISDSSTTKYIFELLLYEFIESHISGILEDIKQSRFVTHFNMFLMQLKIMKRQLVSIDSVKIGTFLIPFTIGSPKLLERVFNENSIWDIGDKIAILSLKSLSRFIQTDFDISKSDSDSFDDSISGGTDSDSMSFKGIRDNEQDEITYTDALMNGLPFIEFGHITATENKAENDKNELFFLALKNLMIEELKCNIQHYIKTVNSEYDKLLIAFMLKYNYEMVNGKYRKMNSAEFLTPCEEFEQIHMPLGRDFIVRYITEDTGLLFKIVTKILFTESTTSCRKEYIHLNEKNVVIDDELIEKNLLIKVLNGQFNINIDHLHEIDLKQLCSIPI